MRRSPAPLAALVLASALALGGCTEDRAPSGKPGAGAGGAALAAVDALTVKGRAPRTGYEREQFGKAWLDTDRNGCATRVISMLRRATEAFAQLMPGVMSCAY